MMDLEEYVYCIQEQDKAVLGMATTVNDIVHCLKYGEEFSGELQKNVDVMNAYRSAFIALSEHAGRLFH